MTAPTPRPVERENALEHLFQTRVRALGGLSVKLAPTRAGTPDRLALLPKGRMYLVELKAHGGRLSPIQRHWHSMARAIGVEVVVLTGRAEILAWVRERADEIAGLPKDRVRRASTAAAEFEEES